MCHRGILWSLTLLALWVTLMATCFAWDACCPIIINSWSTLKLDLLAKTWSFSKSFEISSTWAHKNKNLVHYFVAVGNHVQENYIHIGYNSQGVSISDADDTSAASDLKVEAVQWWLIQCQTGPAAAWSHGEWVLTPYGNECIIFLENKKQNMFWGNLGMRGEGQESHMQVTWEPWNSSDQSASYMPTIAEWNNDTNEK